MEKPERDDRPDPSGEVNQEREQRPTTPDADSEERIEEDLEQDDRFEATDN